VLIELFSLVLQMFRILLQKNSENIQSINSVTDKKAQVGFREKNTRK